MPDWLKATLSVLAGGGLTILSAWLADGRLNTRDRERRREERRERLVARRNDFQRETLLELQSASQQLLRSSGAALHNDTMAYRATGVWQRQLLAEELSDDILRLTTQTMLLSSRIRDEEIRTLADRLRSHVAQSGVSRSEAEAELEVSAAAAAQQALIQRAGLLLRDLDDLD